MIKDYDKAMDALVSDVADLRADMKGILSALHKKVGICVDDAKDSLQESVARRPFASLLAALGVGVVLAGLLRRVHR
jgi:hypothetical protein